LKLEAKKGPVTVYVVEKAERPEDHQYAQRSSNQSGYEVVGNQRECSFAALFPRTPVIAGAEGIDDQPRSWPVSLHGFQQPVIDGADADKNAERGDDRARCGVLDWRCQ